MEDTDRYQQLAQELLHEFAQIGHLLSPPMRNATRGEMAVIHAAYYAAGALTPSELAAQAHVSTARVANILRSLEEKGLVTRTHSTQDRRRVEVALTEDGHAFADRCREERDRELAEFLAELGADDSAELIRIIAKSRQIMERRHEEGRAVCA